MHTQFYLQIPIIPCHWENEPSDFELSPGTRHFLCGTDATIQGQNWFKLQVTRQQ